MADSKTLHCDRERTMAIRMYQIDAFAEHLFAGNPAAVCLLPNWPGDHWLQAVAAENNLSETAFVVPQDDGYAIRWFTPRVEVDLCGHATLAAAHALFKHEGHIDPVIRFRSRSGALNVRCVGDGLEMDFPHQPLTPCETPEPLRQGLGAEPQTLLCGEDFIAVFADQQHILSLRPDFTALAQLPLRGVCVTAPGTDCDFVSRFFAPNCGIAEDPVTGSVHCALAPYWGGISGKVRLQARQLSARGGHIECELQGQRVLLRGRAVTFLQGSIQEPPA